jgi:hypothetical protein
MQFKQTLLYWIFITSSELTNQLINFMLRSILWELGTYALVCTIPCYYVIGSFRTFTPKARHWIYRKLINLISMVDRLTYNSFSQELRGQSRHIPVHFLINFSINLSFLTSKQHLRTFHHPYLSEQYKSLRSSMCKFSLLHHFIKF